MPRRNLLLLVVLTLAAIVCFTRMRKNPYLNVIADAIEVIEQRALEPVGDKQLFEGAMRGMLGQLDENSLYISQDDLDAFKEDIDREFAGVGMEIMVDPETSQLAVRSPMEGMPAHRAGILAGDRILAIDDKSTSGMALPDAMALLRGPEGSPLKLTILHVGEKEPVDVSLVREIIHVDTVIGDTRNEDGSWNYSIAGQEGIGYIRIDSFAETTAAELEYVVEALLEQGMRGLVLDLRDNPGGWLTAAVDVSNFFLSSGVIVTIRRRGGQITESYIATPEASFPNFPIAVIVNQETASAAEIVAACLQDHKRAAIVGQRTYGKGTVQEVLELREDCGAMKLTTASYWRPSGTDIQRPRDSDNGDWGVKPDKGFEVSLTDDEYVAWHLWRLNRDAYQRPGEGKEPATPPLVDRQRAKAVEYVEQLIE